ncbi:MAG: peptidoglycan DD-metalloendopeptidase family protein [Nocardioides sp.]
MRLFPRTARRRWAAAAAAGALAIGALTVPLANAEDLHDREKNVQKQIKHADHALDESSRGFRQATERLEAAQADLDAARAELQKARGKLTAARVRDHEMKVKLDAAEARLAQAETDLVNGRAELANQRELVVDTVNDIYQGANTDLMAAASFLQAQTTEELTRQAEMQDVMVGKQTNAYDALHAAEVLLEVREQQVQDAKDAVAVQRREAAEHLVTMQALTADARAASLRVRDTVQERRGARQQALQARHHDRMQLVQLRKQERKIKDLIAAQAAKARGGFTGATGGFLNRPVPGYVTSPYGYRVHPIYGYYSLHDGTDFHAPCGTPLHAAGTGKVISAYYSSVWGNRLFVGLGNVNGKYVTVIYNHLSGYNASVGQTVQRGQVIGYAGTTGWSTACHLHFTVMVNGQTVDPMGWM